MSGVPRQLDEMAYVDGYSFGRFFIRIFLPTIAAGITIDHAVAMSLPVLSGYIWEAYGFQWVFILAAAIAVMGFFVCLQIRVPEQAPIPDAP